MDVGVDTHDFRPWHFDEISTLMAERVKRRAHRSIHPSQSFTAEPFSPTQQVYAILRMLLRKSRKRWDGFSDGHDQGSACIQEHIWHLSLDEHQFLVLSNLKY